jgi:hypothetical protein
MNSGSKSSTDRQLESLIEDGILEVRETPLSKWDEVNSFTQSKQGWKGWAFRGHADWQWELETTLNRAAKDLDIEDLRKRELGMIRRFRREYRQYGTGAPEEDDYIGWMSIMRHHGAPSRLLDITYSIYVAIYFALVDAHVGHDAALWCFSLDWLNGAYNNMPPRGYNELLQADKRGIFIELFKTVLNDRDPKVYVLNPYLMPDRLTRQNGGLFVPTDIASSFYRNLNSMRKYSGPRPWIIKQRLSLEPPALRDALYHLRKMNITAAVLFPGIDGFAMSMKMLMTIPEETHSYSDTFV